MSDLSCAAPNCTLTRRKSSDFCPTHDSRLKSTGALEPVRPVNVISTSGYRLLNRQYEHRIILRAVIGEDPHPCHWCSRMLAWDVDLQVDHLDSDKLNNDPHNLVPSCGPCNVRRSAAERARATRCRYGHEFTEHNTKINKNGARECRTCINISNLARRRGAAPDRDAAPLPTKDEIRAARLKEYEDLQGGWLAVGILKNRWGLEEHSVVSFLRTAGILLPDRRTLRPKKTKPVRPRLTVADRLHRHSAPQGTCRLWTGATNSEGYGQINIGGRPVYVRRASYELNVGPIPDGMSVRTRCADYRCIEPAHLLLKRRGENRRVA